MAYNERQGNMYPWVDGTHTHGRGGYPHNCVGWSCPHDCTYCSTKHLRCARYFKGPLTLKESELKENYYKFGKGKTIFIEHMLDLFAEGVPEDHIEKVLAHCREYPENTYVLQTKNPARMMQYYTDNKLPDQSLLGTTIETNDYNLLRQYSKAPSPEERASYLGLSQKFKTFVTVEPIMSFDHYRMLELIVMARPHFVNIGADSKHNHLPEPSWQEVMRLIDDLKSVGIEVREKSNLDRLRRE